MIRIRSNEELINYIGSRNGANAKYIYFWRGPKGRNGITKSCMSQWYPSEFSLSDLSFATAEHYMMATKAAIHNDEDSIGKILKAKHPSDAKRLGRKVKNFDDELWNSKRMDVVVTGTCEKFKQNPELLEYLLSTGDKILVEASPVDKIWGIGMAEGDGDINNPSKWRGSNLLGYALMEARDRLREESGEDSGYVADELSHPIEVGPNDHLGPPPVVVHTPDIEECYPYSPYRSKFA